ncbi:hypothetical protein [Bradyrhizobium hereditatis]|nr:hypothetical protein [Bradyrhizobium hereditatis]
MFSSFVTANGKALIATVEKAFGRNARRFDALTRHIDCATFL